MSIANYPFEIVGIDLIGPFVNLENNNKYVLTTIDHCTGCAEAYAIPNKKNVVIENVFMNLFFPQHGYCRS